MLNGDAIHAYVYARWIKQYLNILINYVTPRLKTRGKTWWSERYHGKVISLDQAKTIVTIDKKIPLQDLEQIIPYPKARQLVLNGPPEVTAFNCGCRQARDESCGPIQVCMAIGQPFADFMRQHHPQTSRSLTQAEALDLLQQEHERGHMHTAWFKDACLDRFYAICNCCKCCCGSIEAMVKHNTPMIASSGYVAVVDEGQCTGCSICQEACLFDAVGVQETAAVNWEACMGCGVCLEQCPAEARSLVRDKRKGIPLDVRLLDQKQTAL
jgi:Pyruvate/2-oxoacid:ferredoxin oxidoreductase delta subunit